MAGLGSKRAFKYLCLKLSSAILAVLLCCKTGYNLSVEQVPQHVSLGQDSARNSHWSVCDVTGGMNVYFAVCVLCERRVRSVWMCLNYSARIFSDEIVFPKFKLRFSPPAAEEIWNRWRLAPPHVTVICSPLLLDLFWWFVVEGWSGSHAAVHVRTRVTPLQIILTWVTFCWMIEVNGGIRLAVLRCLREFKKR